VDPIPYGPTAVLQFAISYVNLAVPSTAARVAINIRYFQKLGLAKVRAVLVGSIDGVAGFVVQALLLVVLWFSGASTLDVSSADLGDLDTGGALSTLVIIAAVVGLLAVVAVVVVPRLRHWALDRLHDVTPALQVLRSARKLTQLLGGNLLSQLLFAAALGLSARALGADVSLVDLVLINTLVSLFAGLLPVPGGIGVTEAGLTMGLTAAGLPYDQAFAAALLARVATFYVPPVWGFFALRWLQHHDYL
jgi:uncharacterized membrane protein YbhN (UPF0104 family)